MGPYSSGDIGMTVLGRFCKAENHPYRDGFSARAQDLVAVFKGEAETLASARKTAALRANPALQIRLLAPLEVPYTLPLTQPAVPVELLEGKTRKLAGEARAEAWACICSCRDSRRATRRFCGWGVDHRDRERTLGMDLRAATERALGAEGRQGIFPELR